MSGLLLVCCATGRGEYGQATVGGAVAMTAVAVGAAAISRAQGRCYASCPVGTVCNAATGYCDALPCHGICNSEQQCDTRRLIEHCVPRQVPDLQIETTPASTTTELKTPQ